MIIENLVNKYYENLNENDLYIWNYIRENKKECENISIDNLAKKCNVSRTTILRFTKKLSLSGFSEFKSYLKLDNQNAITDTDYVDKVCSAYSYVINSIRKKDCTEIFQIIDEADNVFVYGDGMVQSSIKKELKRNFLLANKLIYDIEPGEEAETIMAMASPKDVFIIISISGENEYVINYLKRAKLKNIKTISITKSDFNTLSQLSDYNLYIYDLSFPYPLTNAKYESLTSYFILIEIFFLKYIEYKNRGDILESK
mgnify:CR=1 FL=1